MNIDQLVRDVVRQELAVIFSNLAPKPQKDVITISDSPKGYRFAKAAEKFKEKMGFKNFSEASFALYQNSARLRMKFYQEKSGKVSEKSINEWIKYLDDYERRNG